MSSGSTDLAESLSRLFRSLSKAAVREAPYLRRAGEKIVREDLPGLEQAVRHRVKEFNRRWPPS
ncbi:MAG: hypothetical protein M3072_14730 [Candidatus Dormibacteraeota bacterium]|nr:hypothetical protein [Candidatus Dormibacteraeota bacterium]